MHEPVSRKIVSLQALIEQTRRRREDGETIVQCHGCFDIVHPGHIRYLQFARQLGDVLVVSLTGDALIEKAPDRPLIPQELRAENLAALEFVDWVVIDSHPTACEILESLKPDVYVKGREYAGSSDPRFVREREIVERHGGRVVFSSGDVVFSSTRLMETISGDRALDQHRLTAFCRRAEIDEPVLCDTLEAFAGVRAVVVGDLINERYVFTDASEVAADAPVMSLQELGSQSYWGGAAAVALQLQALGARPFLLSRVGRNAASAEAARQFAQLGVCNHLMRDRPDMIERTTVVADETKLFVLNKGVTAPLDSAAEKSAAEILSDHLADAQLIIWCDYGFGMLTPGLLATVNSAIGARDVFRAGHAPSRRGQLLGGLDLLSVTERRLREAMHDMNSGLSAVAWKLLDQTGGQSTIVSLHKRGLICFDRQSSDPNSDSWRERLRSEFVPSFATRYIDALGAQESGLTIAALTRTVGRSIEMATYFAGAIESLTAARIGGGAVRSEQLRNWIAQQRELLPQSRFQPESPTVIEQATIDALSAVTPDAAKITAGPSTRVRVAHPPPHQIVCH